MTDAIIKRFIKNSEDVKNPDVRLCYGKLAGGAGIVSNLLLFIIKGISGLLAGSIAMLADAVNNLSDAGSSIITLFGFKLSGKHADAEHPYGHARMEYIAGFSVSIVILLLGWELGKTSVQKIITPEPADYSIISMLVLAVSIVIKLWQCNFNKSIGKRIDSQTLQATAADSMNDVIATSAVLIGAIIGKLTGWRLDAWMGLGVALFIVWSGVNLIIDTSNLLLGTAPPKELVKKIHDTIISTEGVMGVHDLMVHSYGPEQFYASVHVEVPASQDIMVSHDIINNIEYELLRSDNLHLVVHLDPVVTDDEHTNTAREEVRNLLSGISPELTMHDFRMIPGKKHVNCIFDVNVPPQVKMSDAAIRYSLIEGINAIDPLLHVTVIIDRNSLF